MATYVSYQITGYSDTIEGEMWAPGSHVNANGKTYTIAAGPPDDWVIKENGVDMATREGVSLVGQYYITAPFSGDYYDAQVYELAAPSSSSSSSGSGTPKSSSGPSESSGSGSGSSSGSAGSTTVPMPPP